MVGAGCVSGIDPPNKQPQSASLEGALVDMQLPRVLQVSACCLEVTED